jgi:ubiquinone/menaquinone biosynthesis C-methylase UbiE
MLGVLRRKCGRYIAPDNLGPGIIIVRQDIISLLGFADDICDYAILNNVLYAVEDYKTCLQEAYRVLRKGGEIRISGPRKDTSLDALFKQIKEELGAAGKFGELEKDYRHVCEINMFRLKPLLHRWSIEEMSEILLSTGFSEIIYTSEDIYAGQSMLICARK